MGRSLALLGVAVALGATAEVARAQGPSASERRPSFEGTWSSATTTPLERPNSLRDKPFFTPEEAAAWTQRFLESNQDPPPGTQLRGTGTFNAVYREYIGGVVKTLRTSIVTDPPDGRIPALTPEANAARRIRNEAQNVLANPEDLALQDRCVMFSTSGPPMLPYSYNSHYQIVQTADALVVHAEMIHDARVIPLDGRPHLPPNLRLRSGDSVGRWEADTLVVEATNFTNNSGFYGSAGGHFGWDDNLRVVERLSFYDDDTLLYRFEIEDPTAFTRPWKGELTLTRTTAQIYEYACHEGNYAMEGMLRGARATEREAAGGGIR